MVIENRQAPFWANLAFNILRFRLHCFSGVVAALCAQVFEMPSCTGLIYSFLLGQKYEKYVLILINDI